MADLFPNQWSALKSSKKLSPEEEFLAMIGQEALASGQVSPEEAKANAAALAVKKVNPQPTKAAMGNTTPARAAATKAAAQKAPAAPKAPLDPLSMEANPVQTETDKVIAEYKNQRKMLEQMNTYLPEEESLAQYEAAMRAPHVQEQMQGLDQMRDMILSMPQAQAQLDISPVLALVDSQTGSKLLQGYKRPEDPSSQGKRILDYMMKLQDDRNAISQRVAEAVKSRKSGTSALTQLFDYKQAEEFAKKLEDARVLDAKKAGRGGDPSVRISRFGKDFDAIIKPHRETVESANRMELLVQKPNWLTDRSLQAALLQSAKLAPISNYELGMFQGNPGVVERFSAMLTRLEGGGAFLPEDRDLVASLARELSAYARKNVEEQTKEFISGNAPFYGITEDQAYNAISARLPRKAPGAAKPAAATAAPKAGLSDAEKKRLEELRAKKAAAGGK